MSSRRNNSSFNQWPRNERMALGLGINFLGAMLLILHGIGVG